MGFTAAGLEAARELISAALTVLPYCVFCKKEKAFPRKTTLSRVSGGCNYLPMWGLCIEMGRGTSVCVSEREGMDYVCTVRQISLPERTCKATTMLSA